MKTGLWACPVCRGVMRRNDRQWICENAHSFDVAKEGYVNLLPVNQKHSVSPGDDAQMMRSRREFLAQGYYVPLVNELVRMCTECVETRASGSFSLLDTGCGEGYYTQAITVALHQAFADREISVAGIDISRAAVRMAAKSHKLVQFAVASNASIPVQDESLDVVLRIFAPGADSEIQRILKPGGYLLCVTPGPRHLYSLRELVYQSPRLHKADVQPVSGLVHASRSSLEFDMHVRGDGAVARLFSMTPFFWHASRAQRDAIVALQQLDTEVSFYLDLYRKPS